MSIYKWKPITSRRWGRLKGRLEDNMLNGLKMMKEDNWKTEMTEKELLRGSKLQLFSSRAC